MGIMTVGVQKWDLNASVFTIVDGWTDKELDAYIRGSCKKFCHWVQITSVLRFIKHILLQTFKIFPLY